MSRSMENGLGVAEVVRNTVERALGTPLPVGVSAWDGSRAGPTEGPRVVLRRARALRHLLWSPGELGAARAFVSGDLDVEGDLVEGLRRCWELAREHGLRGNSPPHRRWWELGRAAVRLGALGPRPPVPACEARLSGTRHSRTRDRSVISHHYDLGNEFYELLLDPTLTYSCGYFTDERDDLETAQYNKLDLVCRELGLRPGQRLLDVGCGWGSLVVHAARNHGVRASGITLSRQQYEYANNRIERLGLGELASVRLLDYRDLTDRPYDAVASLEMGEHVGADNYPTYLASLFRMLRPHGRLLLQQMSRGSKAPGGGAFIESYIAPDMTMTPVGHTLDRLETAGFEIRGMRALREHYARTVRLWARRLYEHEPEALRILGAQRYRVWRLYLAGGGLAFAENRMGVDQILATRPARDEGRALFSGEGK
nr:cyclopropane-fatty-acyl-phospholipid synthase family protein [Actinopolyspora mortivallis]